MIKNMVREIKRKINVFKLMQLLETLSCADNIVVIMRAIPGAGKSTLSKKICDKFNGIIHSTDNYFINDKGEYKFDSLYIHEYHKRNYDAFCNSLTDNIKCVIVDNTNLRYKWYKDYVKTAIKNKYIVIEVLINPTSYSAEECKNRSVHNVPLETVKVMRDNLLNNMDKFPECHYQVVI